MWSGAALSAERLVEDMERMIEQLPKGMDPMGKMPQDIMKQLPRGMDRMDRMDDWAPPSRQHAPAIGGSARGGHGACSSHWS